MLQLIRITYFELIRMFARQRTYMGYAAFAAFNLVFVIILSRPGPSKLFRRPLESAGYLFDEYFSALTLGFAILSLTTMLLMLPFLALVSGDVVSKEAEDGNLRLILSRPVSRLRLLLSKFISCHLYTVTLVTFVGLLSLAMGAILAKWDGGLFVVSPPTGLFAVFDFETGVLRYAIALGLLGLSMSTVSSVAFLFSCQRIKPAAATILTICIFFIDRILWNVPYFADYRNWFLSPHMGAWLGAFEERINWLTMTQHYAFLFGVSATCFIVGWLTFQQRDLKA